VAVFTKLNDNDFTSILRLYDIGELVSFEGISEGVENTNYKLTTSKNTYILTIYEKRVRAEDLPFFMSLMVELNRVSFPCPEPIVDKNGVIINKINDKNFTIVSFLNGKWPKAIGNDEVIEAGKILAQLHKASRNFDLARENNMGSLFWLDTYSKVKDQAEEHFKDLKPAIEKGFELIKKWPRQLPSGVIHGDFFPDNVLFNGNKISGVIDFYMACNDSFAYEIAIVLNAWCFEKNYEFNITKAKLFLSSYNDIRPLDKAELEFLPVLCVGASLRFLSTRLYDFFNRKKDALVNVKDPREYIEKLKFHLQIKSHFEYGL